MPRSGNKGNFDEVLASLIQAHTGALQPLINGKECYIVIVIYLSYKHKQFQIQSTLDTSNFKGLGKICRVISSSR